MSESDKHSWLHKRQEGNSAIQIVELSLDTFATNIVLKFKKKLYIFLLPV